MKTVLTLSARMAILVLNLSWLEASAQMVEADESALRSAGTKKGVVLVDIYWARAWRCGRFENAQLRSLSFERAPLLPAEEQAAPALVFENPSRLTPPQRFVSYAIVVEPGEYHLTGFELGFARSVSDLGVNLVKRAESVVNGRSRFGSFSVSAGEFVYIGNFAIDCYKTPIPWRYYTKGKADFATHLAQYKAKYPALPVDAVIYRLFATSELGDPYEIK